jgi:hypothetical protein
MYRILFLPFLATYPTRESTEISLFWHYQVSCRTEIAFHSTNEHFKEVEPSVDIQRRFHPLCGQQSGDKCDSVYET